MIDPTVFFDEYMHRPGGSEVDTARYEAPSGGGWHLAPGRVVCLNGVVKFAISANDIASWQ